MSEVTKSDPRFENWMQQLKPGPIAGNSKEDSWVPDCGICMDDPNSGCPHNRTCSFCGRHGTLCLCDDDDYDLP